MRMLEKCSILNLLMLTIEQYDVLHQLRCRVRQSIEKLLRFHVKQENMRFSSVYDFSWIVITATVLSMSTRCFDAPVKSFSEFHLKAQSFSLTFISLTSQSNWKQLNNQKKNLSKCSRLSQFSPLLLQPALNRPGEQDAVIQDAMLNMDQMTSQNSSPPTRVAHLRFAMEDLLVRTIKIGLMSYWDYKVNFILGPFPCPTGLHFDSTRQVCALPEEAGCQASIRGQNRGQGWRRFGAEDEE